MKELHQRFDSPEITLWYAYFSIEGWPEERADARTGIVAMTTAAPWTKRSLKLQDFVPRYEPKEKTPWEMVQAYFLGQIEKEKNVC